MTDYSELVRTLSLACDGLHGDAAMPRRACIYSRSSSAIIDLQEENARLREALTLAKPFVRHFIVSNTTLAHLDEAQRYITLEAIDAALNGGKG